MVTVMIDDANMPTISGTITSSSEGSSMIITFFLFWIGARIGVEIGRDVG